jgi:hypothetical protein
MRVHMWQQRGNPTSGWEGHSRGESNEVARGGSSEAIRLLVGAQQPGFARGRGVSRSHRDSPVRGAAVRAARRERNGRGLWPGCGEQISLVGARQEDLAS